jgi:quinol monooxygenase YgiN
MPDEYITLRRWMLKEGAEEAPLLALIRDEIVPAYKRQPGCRLLELVRLTPERTYLAVTVWESRAAFDAWAGEGGQTWRDAYRLSLERWLELMTFLDDTTGEVVLSG